MMKKEIMSLKKGTKPPLKESPMKPTKVSRSEKRMKEEKPTRYLIPPPKSHTEEND